MVAKDTGPLSWNIPIVTPDGRPTPEFQRRWETQRNNNALIGTVTFGTGAPTGVPQDGAEYVDTSTTPYTLYLGRKGTWHQVGVIKFTDLTDAPHNYTSAAGKIVRVNAGATGLEFDSVSVTLDSLGTPATNDLLMRGASAWTIVTPSGVLDTLGSTQGDILYRGASGWAVLAPGTSGQVLTTGGASANPAWATASGGGGGGGGGNPYEAGPTIPSAANFTLQNAGTSALSSVSGGMSLIDNTTATSQIRFASSNTAPPATPYCVIIRTTEALPVYGGSYTGGLYMRNSTSGRITMFTQFQNNILAQNWTSFTAFSGNVVGPAAIYSGSVAHWYAIGNDGTNLNYYYSEDGVTWGKVGTQTIASFMTGGGGTIDQLGVGIMNNGTICGAGFQSFSVISGATPSGTVGNMGGHAYEAFGALPLAATFSHYNWQTGTTLTDSPYSLNFNLPGQGGFNMQIAYKAAPVSTPYDVYARMSGVWWNAASRGGLCLFNSSTKRTLTLGYINANQIGTIDDTGPATFNSSGTTFTGQNGVMWFRWNNNGTLLTPYVSGDGVNWLQVSAGFTASTYAADSVGIQACNAPSTTEPTALWVYSFGTTAPA